MNRKRIEKYLIELLIHSKDLKNQKKMEIYLKEIKKLINEMFETSKPNILILSEKETTILRIRFGILNNGGWQQFEYIGKYLKVREQEAYRMYYKAIEKLKKHLDIKISEFETPKINKMSSIEQNDSLIYLRNKRIAETGLDSYIENCLARNNIYTVEELLSRSKTEIKNLHGLGKTTLERIITKIHELGLAFIDELTEEEKITIIKKQQLEVIEASSIAWLPLSDSKINEYLKKYGINNIKKLKEALINKTIINQKIVRYMKETRIITEEEKKLFPKTIKRTKSKIEKLIEHQNELQKKYDELVQEKKDAQLEATRLNEELSEVLSQVENKGDNHLLTRK